MSKKITTSEFVYPKKSLHSLAYPKKSLSLFFATQKIPLFFPRLKNIPACFMDPNKSHWAKISDPKNHLDPPSLKYVSGAPGIICLDSIHYLEGKSIYYWSFLKWRLNSTAGLNLAGYGLYLTSTLMHWECWNSLNFRLRCLIFKTAAKVLYKRKSRKITSLYSRATLFTDLFINVFTLCASKHKNKTATTTTKY